MPRTTSDHRPRRPRQQRGPYASAAPSSSPSTSPIATTSSAHLERDREPGHSDGTDSQIACSAFIGAPCAVRTAAARAG